MKSKLFFLLVATISLLTACTDKTAKWKVKTTYHVNKFKMEDSLFTNDGLTYTLLYSDDGKLIGNTISSGNRTEFITTPTADTTKTFNSRGEVIESEVSLKNSKGLVDSVTQHGMFGTTNKYTYDAEGNEVETRQYKFGNQLEFVERKKYSAGLNISTLTEAIGSRDTIMMINPKNLEEETIVQTNIGDTSTYHYEFYPNKENSKEYVKYLKEHWGEGSVQLKKTKTQVSSKGDTVNVYNYRYTFDDQNRVTSIVSESIKSAEYDSTSYSYY